MNTRILILLITIFSLWLFISSMYKLTESEYDNARAQKYENSSTHTGGSGNVHGGGSIPTNSNSSTHKSTSGVKHGGGVF